MDYKRWLRLMAQLNIRPNEQTFNKLSALYSEKHRFHHNKSHINTALDQLDSCRDFSEFPQHLELALYFHDAIYNPMSPTNEKDSADLATSFLLNNNCSQTTTNKINTLIMSTLYTHKPISVDEKLMIDIGLSILGSSEKEFQKTEGNIRKEYKIIPIFIYKKRRKEIFYGFLKRKNIYLTSYFFNKYEDQARRNLMNICGIY